MIRLIVNAFVYLTVLALDILFMALYYAGLFSWGRHDMTKSKKTCKPKPKGNEPSI